MGYPQKCKESLDAAIRPGHQDHDRSSRRAAWAQTRAIIAMREHLRTAKVGHGSGDRASETQPEALARGPSMSDQLLTARASGPIPAGGWRVPGPRHTSRMG
jgi:hypothetical protein